MAVSEKQNLIGRWYCPWETVVAALEQAQTCDRPYRPFEADPQAVLVTVKLGWRLRFLYEGDQRAASGTQSQL